MPYRPDRAALISLVAGGPDTSPMSPRRNQSLRKSFPFDKGFTSPVSATSIVLGALEVGLIQADRSYSNVDFMHNRGSG